MWDNRQTTTLKNTPRHVNFCAEHDLNGGLLLPNLQQDGLSVGGQFPIDEPWFVPPSKVRVEGLNVIIVGSSISVGPFLSRLIDPKHEHGRHLFIQPVYDIETMEGTVKEWLRRFPTPHNYYTYAEHLIEKMGFSRPKI